ncbi:FAD-dependent oxidoreductase [Pigmentibacter sp. JX0631]|uniref:phytoene desaturase family protein n=1 Tax=Pigmentibacter sp. JX0631 TaxID=2976982 RepID=UPI002468474B|nr:FAD-dependent oxidoreductase [Pigmentibacter sp. JX0631]WGL61549.1 FAD-dependent oxidoreductase [Pigmentibacter sp. JX0631]
MGAGVSGLTVANLLVKQGFNVEIFESAERCGGKMFQYKNADGICWDTGPTLISLPQELNNLFLDLNISDIELLKLQTGSQLNFSDGTNWELPVGLDSIKNYFAKYSNKLRQEISDALEISSAIFDFAEKNIFYKDPPNVISLGFKSFASGLILKHPKLTLTPYRKVVDTLISDLNMREFFYHFSSYVGMNPDEAQGGILSIAHVELVSPVVFPKGGVYQIASILEQEALKNKVKIHLNSLILSAQLKNINNPLEGWNIEIKKDDKTHLAHYDIVISNSDPFTAAFTWLNKTDIAKNYLDKISKNMYRPSESQFVILFDLYDDIELHHHVKIFPESWRESFIQVCEYNQLPSDPCIYLVWPHATDKSISPRVLFISAMAPNNLSGINWSNDFSLKYAEQILEICRKRLKYAFKGKIFKMVSPQELEDRANSFKGGIYSACLKKFNPLAFHESGSTKYKNLYFVGAGIHPGAGVTMVIKSAKRIAQHISKNFK